MNFNGKTVLITGASRGIGRECALEFARQGASNIIIGYNKSESQALELEAVLRDSGVNALALKADIRSAEEVKRMFRRAQAAFGAVHILVNNAGISGFSLFTDITEEMWDEMMDTNIKGMYLACREALPDMISEKDGAIVNISSIWGQVGASCEVHYSVSKAAVIGLTKALAKELGPSNVRVNCVAPGVIRTDMLAVVDPAIQEELKEETPLMKLGNPIDIAKSVCFLCSDEAGFITGQVLGVNGGFVI
ncbi:MAG: SDR family oxidoreductase [Firmicutes bacterium]|nr:SDR family oxidoreductase [Bacillota bacterium]